MVRFDDCRLIGKIGKPHGHNGAVKLLLNPDYEIDLNIDEPVFLLIEGKPVPFYMLECNEAANPPILHFEDINNPESAKSIQGLSVYAPKESVDSDFDFDPKELLGFMVLDGKQPIGPLTEISDSGLQQLMVIDCKGKEVLIPFQPELIEDVLEDEKQIIMNLPEGLLNLYL